MIVTRFHNLEKLAFDVEFLSPTFLGGADQHAELRSAPFKNLLRQWWRVANGHRSATDLRKIEGELFGTVLGDNSAQASQVRLVLEKGKIFSIANKLPNLQPRLNHPNVKVPVDRLLYLGYGPISKITRDFITPGSVVNIAIYIKKSTTEMFEKTISLLHHFGTIGSRSRNGFGSISLNIKNKIQLSSLPQLIKENISFADRMTQENKTYPAQLCLDEKNLLCWEYMPDNPIDVKKAWQEILHNFAEIYMKTRTQFKFTAKNELEARHLLGYPAGQNHVVAGWGSRMPSQLRLMVKRNEQEQIVGRILHLAHPIPKKWDNKLGAQTDIWKKVHSFLDGQPSLKRCGGV